MRRKGSWIYRFLSKTIKPQKRTALQFYQLTDAFPNPLLIANREGKIIYVNPAWERVTGYSLLEVQRKNLQSVLQEEAVSAGVYKKIWSSFKTGKSYSIDKGILLTKNQKKYNVHTLFFPIMRGGRPYYLVQTSHDISSFIKIQKKLQEKEQLFQEMVDNSEGFAIYVMNKKGKIINWNRSAESMVTKEKK